MLRRSEFKRAISIAGGTLVAGVFFVFLATPYVSGFVLVLGALLILTTGLYFCANTLGVMNQLAAQKRVDTHSVQEQFYDITARIHEVLKSAWMEKAKPASAKGRLRAAVRSWHEDMISDIPAFNPELETMGFSDFLGEADEVLQCIETMDIKAVDDEELLEAAEHQVIDILERLGEFAPGS